MTAELLWSYDTRVWRQRLAGAGGTWKLTRSYRDRGAASPDVRSVDQLVASLPGSGLVTFVAPERRAPGGDDESEFLLTASEVLAGLLWPTPDVSGTGVALVELMTALGESLARLQRAPFDGGASWSPQLRRLRAHLEAAPGTPAGRVLSTASPAVRGEVARWLGELPAHGVLCHGGFTLGSVFTTRRLTTAEVPVGPELTRTIPEFDLGWMLGELTEFEYQAGVRGSDGAVFALAGQALLDGWERASGSTPGPRWLNRFIAARYLTHLCDFAETTGAADAVAADLPFLAWLVEQGAASPDSRVPVPESEGVAP